MSIKAVGGSSSFGQVFEQRDELLCI
jgi:hypothetical protein